MNKTTYQLFRPLLFLFSAEKSHHLTLKTLKLSAKLGLLALFSTKIKTTPTKVMGINFPNQVGLAAGLDKNGDYLNALSQLGFGFIEIGTITPRPQPGNPSPRLFRLPKANAIINRMGFNNQGIKHLLQQVEKVRQSGHRGIIGINIGKNFDTSVENAADDYLIALREAYSLADYITINISSPNTPGLRDLQYGDELNLLLSTLKQEQLNLSKQTNRYVPLAVKVAPDLSHKEVQFIAKTLLDNKIDCLIATNTTLSRDAVKGMQYGDEAGGLSGEPVRDLSTEIIRQFAQSLGDQIPIIGVGGIACGDDAVDKIKAGAKLVQVFSALIYQGPALVADCVQALEDYQHEH
ncbi:MAG TPA: quinone-dependent dihydroorotate dehydrogenase [Leucothrix mucor]|uniref:Dihydroorotate dehydrogenase (quinone) n=1 Tax=Leucothrix mucor TaxID=45248 RepID=A0A7V2SYH2_LEUMU|nr:quinone-dependent dihydroorotate dehydrogenase [Leucothrix mucor]